MAKSVSQRMREYRARKKARGEKIPSDLRYRKRDPVKKRAWNAVSGAIRSGKLKRQPCEICGDPNSQAHHDDYSRPLDVRWLCRAHHEEHHHGT
jgi:hypothetical protein